MLTDKDIKKLKAYASMLGNALIEINEIIEKAEANEQPRIRRNLKEERKNKYLSRFASGQMTRKLTP